METEPSDIINNAKINTIAEEILSYYQTLLLPHSDLSLNEGTTEFSTIIQKRKNIFDYIIRKYNLSEKERSRLNDVLAKKIALKKKSG